jgi:hypothetical protein
MGQEIMKRPAALFPIALRTSRRDGLRLLGTAGAIGALQLLNAKETGADSETKNMGGLGGQIDPTLLQALQFDRFNSEDPGVAFSPDTGLLVGFGPNLYHADSSRTTLFQKGQQVLTTSIRQNVQENITALTPGTSGNIVQTTQDRFFRVVNATTTVESIHDIPDDFLITGQTESNNYTGAFFKITVSIATPQASILTFTVTPGTLFNKPANSIIDLDAVSLQATAAQIIVTKLSTADGLILSDLQQDFSFGKIFRAVAVGLVLGPIAAQVYVIAPKPVQRAEEQAAFWLFLAVLSGVAGNAAYDGLKDAMKQMTQPQCPPGLIPNPIQPPPPNQPACVIP